MPFFKQILVSLFIVVMAPTALAHPGGIQFSEAHFGNAIHEVVTCLQVDLSRGLEPTMDGKFLCLFQLQFSMGMVI